ncbi:MAG: bifunctional 23S rRNA (guanine(2069)-N(7))-methyltransferase RlmK/23S rRNA (guanine(2445)-N(2))-methyltransferase RlmL [Desulfobulbus sp.]|jgi:23S rRNA (guanine2445-N2)-methyltransferase / 23S rRNA (guanine2069-N7)-methyltransferase
MYRSAPIAKKKKRQPLHFVATCGFGLEELVAEEIAACGGQNITTGPGAVSWTGNLETGYRACLWSRFASRILLELARFEAPSTDDLYEQAGRILWDDHMGIRSTFAVHTTLVNSSLPHSQFASLRVKDAVVDQFRKRFGKRPDVDPSRPDIRINLYVQGTEASLSLDLSGESLHRRGYRTGGGEAPLKETLAAAIVRLSGWLERSDSEPVLLDPMCGSGTLLIEAALMLAKSAPGLQRKSFGFMSWNRHDPRLWERLVQEALDQEGRNMPASWPLFIGYDTDPVVVAAARKNVIAAGLRDVITIKQRPLARLRVPAPAGCLLTNPPYGERLSDKETVKYLYRCLERIFLEEFSGWSIALFTANPDLTGGIQDIVWRERFRLFNGPIRCQLMLGSAGKRPERPAHAWNPQPLPPGTPGEDFANRLIKNCTVLLPWARGNDITCFRLYDADMPEFNMAIDLYESWVHVQEYAAPPGVDQDKAAHRFELALQTIRSVLDVPRNRLFIKTRKKQKGTQQYQKKNEGGGLGTLYEVREGGARFLVNFTDYLDTGLFLDHRITRARLGALASGKTLLNLFAYTGSATVYAAMHGAISTTTVDISDTYLARADANLAINGFGGPTHQLVAADCMEWLEQCTDRFGVIFLDPPTFSNTRHRKQTFNVQQDHPALLRLAMQRLTKNGVLLFSTNFRKFRLDPELEQEFAFQEITAETLPLDFQRNNRIHRCWEVRHPPAP